jgi:hypothetical protein
MNLSRILASITVCEMDDLLKNKKYGFKMLICFYKEKHFI